MSQQLTEAPAADIVEPPPRFEEPADPMVTVIEPVPGWRMLNVVELWNFRELLYFLTWRDVKVRYKQTVLGAAWAILQPAMMMAVFTIFFRKLANVASDDIPYPIFVYAGLLPWTFFASAVSNAGNSVVGSERLISKIYFPRLLVPLASVAAAVVDFVIAFGLMILLMIYYGVAPGWGMLMVPVIFAVIMLAACGFGAVLSALNVTYRDFRYMIPFMIQLWMFATPTVYMQPAEGDSAANVLLTLNPMTWLIGAFRSAVLGGPIPWARFGVCTLFALAAFFIGCMYFRKAEAAFVDII